MPRQPTGFFGFTEANHNPELFYDELDRDGVYVDRALAETNVAFRQVIPYVVLSANHPHGLQNPPFLLAFERLIGGGEGRLHNKVALGFGGHTPWEDGLLPREMLFNSLARELEEELGLAVNPAEAELYGQLIADASAVDRVHLGVVFHLSLGDMREELFNLRTLEPEKIAPFWVSARDVYRLPNLETWAQLVAPAFGA